MKGAFTTILMATDFRPESHVALRSCAALARQLSASIHLLHVAHDPMASLSAPELYAIDWNNFVTTSSGTRARRLPPSRRPFPTCSSQPRWPSADPPKQSHREPGTSEPI